MGVVGDVFVCRRWQELTQEGRRFRNALRRNLARGRIAVHQRQTPVFPLCGRADIGPPKG